MGRRCTSAAHSREHVMCERASGGHRRIKREKRGAPIVKREPLLKRIVVPVDESEFSARAVPAAAAVGHASGAVVRLLGVASEDVDVESMLERLSDASKLL